MIRVSNTRVSDRLEPDDGRFWLILRDMGVRPDNVSAVIVTFLREGLTDDVPQDTSIDTASRDASAEGSQDDLPF